MPNLLLISYGNNFSTKDSCFVINPTWKHIEAHWSLWEKVSSFFPPEQKKKRKKKEKEEDFRSKLNYLLVLAAFPW